MYDASYYDWEQVGIDVLKDKTLVSVIKSEYDSNDCLDFLTDDGELYRMYHRQDCCESVYIEDICGDLEDLTNSPVLFAYGSSNSDNPKDQEYPDESFTWTFYTISTIKGTVDIRWYGSSNGYYSEEADFAKVK